MNPTYQEEYYKQYYYHPDHLGSASLITDYKGDEYQRIEYTPYGETWVEKTQNTGLEFLPYRFTGKEIDEETGLYYYGARYLDPKYSRWISTDPALGEYIPKAPINEEAKRYNQNLPGMGGVFNHINGNLYHYAGNNPMKYTDPDGRKHGLPHEIQKKMKERAINNSIDFTDYNHIQQCKVGPIKFKTALLTQRIAGKTVFPEACIYFSEINSFLMAGYKPNGFYIYGLDKYVNDNRFDKHGKPVSFTDMASKVFSLTTTWKEIPVGLSEEQLREEIGDNPAVLYYEQKEFWGNNDLEGVHGIAYYKGDMFEPYMARKGTDFSDVRGKKSVAVITDYVRGFYMEIEQK